MSRTLSNWLLAVSLSLNLGIGAAVVLERATGAPEAAPAGLPDRLDLTPAQRDRWREAERGFLADLGDNWREIHTQRETLVRQIFAETPQRDAIDAAQARIAQLQDRQQRRVIAQLLAERELLTRPQQLALMQALLERYARESTQEENLHRN
ncbi:MAG: hypothetical protein B7X93_01790 [Hydrogenophilales bacterium 17-61-9]|nr:MAG: hypothetical protein B7X93_01790 [Hydrogenophilales bacterium 17-61-9]